LSTRLLLCSVQPFFQDCAARALGARLGVSVAMGFFQSLLLAAYAYAHY